jgi:hypothetical protein
MHLQPRNLQPRIYNLGRTAMKACMVAYAFYEVTIASTLRGIGRSVAIRWRRSPSPTGSSCYEVIRGVHVYRIQERSINETGPLSYLIAAAVLRSTFLLAWRHIQSPYGLIHVHRSPISRCSQHWFPSCWEQGDLGYS